MPHPYLPCPYSDWHDWGDAADSMLNGTAEFAAAAPTVTVGANLANYECPTNQRPVGEINEHGGSVYQLVIEQSTISPGNDYLGDPITVRDQQPKLLKLSGAAELQDTVDLSPGRPEVRETAAFREVKDWQIEDDYNWQGLVGNFVDGFGIVEKNAASDGLAGPGRPALAYIPDAQAEIYGVTILDGYAIPRYRLANRLYGVRLSDGARWEAKGFSGYPHLLAAWHPNHDGYDNPYPWGTSFGSNGLQFSWDLFSVIGPVDAEHFLCVRERRHGYPEFISDFGRSYTTTVDYPAWTSLASDPFTITTTFEARWRLAFSRPYQIDPNTPANNEAWRPFGRRETDAQITGKLAFSPLHRFSINPDPAPAPNLTTDFQSRSAALSAITSDMVGEFNSVAAVPQFNRVKVYKSELFLEVRAASTGNVVTTVTSSLSQVVPQVDTTPIINGPSTISQQVSTGSSYVFGLEPVADWPNYWKPSSQPAPNKVGGGEGDLQGGYGQLAHNINDNSADGRTSWAIRSQDAGLATNITAPSGNVFSEGSGGVPSPDTVPCDTVVLSTIYAPQPGGEITVCQSAQPFGFSESNYCSDGSGLLIFCPRFFRSVPRWIANSEPSDPELVIAWNNALEGASEIRAYDVDFEGTVTERWRVNALDITGRSYNVAGLLLLQNGTCPANPRLTSRYLWLDLTGKWNAGFSQVETRRVQIDIEDGSVIATYPIATPADSQNYREVGDPTIIHNRRIVSLVNGKMVEYK